MKAFSTALFAAGIALLGACGGGQDADTANEANTADIVTLPEDEGELGGETLGNEADALGLGNGGDLNAADANLASDANLGGDANLTGDANATVNAQ